MQIILHNQGYKFIYTPKIVGIHDACISNVQLLKKMRYEILAMGNILLKVTEQRASLEVPYLPFFLSFPLSLILSLIFYFFISKIFILSVIFFASTELMQGLPTFTITGYSKTKKTIAFFYLILKECIQAICVPVYLTYKIRSFHQFTLILRILNRWEMKKIKRFATLIGLN